MDNKFIYLNLPYMRRSLVYETKDLSDRQCQEEQWLANSTGRSFYWKAQFAIEFFIEDMSYEEYPKDQIGWTIYDWEELGAVLLLTCAVKKAMHTIGYEKNDEEYLNSPFWEAVIQAAQHAYPILLKNDQKYMPMMRPSFVASIKDLWHIKQKHGKNFADFFKKICQSLDRFSVLAHYPLTPDQINEYWIIKDEKEVEALTKLREAIFDFAEDIGLFRRRSDFDIEKLPDIPDAVCLNSPYLDKMQQAAGEAYKVLSANDSA